VLLNVTSAGSHPLNLKLVGTDGESVYVASSKCDKLSEYPDLISSVHLSLQFTFGCFFPPNPLRFTFYYSTVCASIDVDSPSVEHRRISKLRTSNYDGPTEEWEDALMKTLLGQFIEGRHRSALADLECVASASSGRELTIVWRRHIKGITVRAANAVL
jgi:hypothetical protein